jgi:Uma2 family endonuclease
MQEMIQNPPRTILEVFKMLPEGTRAELIEGILYISPAPFLNHQDALVSLTLQIGNYLAKKKLGKIYVSPVDVYLNDNNAYQPDLVVVLNDNISILKDHGIAGAPDLVVEILSPGTKQFDQVNKKKIYEKSGVKEYWIVDPATKECVGYLLKKGKFSELKKEKGKINSSLLKHIFKF